MPTDVVMPQMGESITEGTLTKWLKKVGDSIQRDEPLFEISTDKVDAEIPSPAAGTLQEIKTPEGSTVQINTVVAVISEGAGGTVAAAAAPPASATW
jgi:pyruvate dehydrogenase E2 component (dihydrolipoamide acetyltransferase)